MTELNSGVHVKTFMFLKILNELDLQYCSSKSTSVWILNAHHLPKPYAKSMCKPCKVPEGLYQEVVKHLRNGVLFWGFGSLGYAHEGDIKKLNQLQSKQLLSARHCYSDLCPVKGPKQTVPINQMMEPLEMAVKPIFFISVLTDILLW